jgi:DNA-binding MarR family transcriptional regulator
MDAVPDLDAAEQVVRVLPRVLRFIARGLASEALTLGQLRVLHALVRGERPSSEVADELAVRLPTLTEHVGPLVRLGYVVRRRDPADARSVLLGLTPAGHEAHRQALEAARVRAEELLAGLTPAQRTRLACALADLGALVARREEGQPTAPRDGACQVYGEAIS